MDLAQIQDKCKALGSTALVDFHSPSDEAMTQIEDVTVCALVPHFVGTPRHHVKFIRVRGCILYPGFGAIGGKLLKVRDYSRGGRERGRVRTVSASRLVRGMRMESIPGVTQTIFHADPEKVTVNEDEHGRVLEAVAEMLGRKSNDRKTCRYLGAPQAFVPEDRNGQVTPADIESRDMQTAIRDDLRSGPDLKMVCSRVEGRVKAIDGRSVVVTSRDGEETMPPPDDEISRLLADLTGRRITATCYPIVNKGDHVRVDQPLWTLGEEHLDRANDLFTNARYRRVLDVLRAAAAVSRFTLFEGQWMFPAELVKGGKTMYVRLPTRRNQLVNLGNGNPFHRLNANPWNFSFRLETAHGLPLPKWAQKKAKDEPEAEVQPDPEPAPEIDEAQLEPELQAETVEIVSEVESD